VHVFKINSEAAAVGGGYDGMPRFIREGQRLVPILPPQASNTSRKYQTFVHIYSTTNYDLLPVSNTLIDATIAASKAAVSRIPAMDDESSAHAAKSNCDGNSIGGQHSRSRSSTRRKRRRCRWR